MLDFHRTPAQKEKLIERPLVALLVFVGAFGILSGLFALNRTNFPVIYQGRLTDSAYLPVTDSARNVRIKIWDDSTAGSCVWSTGNSTGSANCALGNGATSVVSVNINNGNFTIPLGNGGTNNPEITTNFSSGDYFIEVIVDNENPVGTYETLSPRKQLGSAPYAYDAAYLNGKSLDGVSGGQTFIGGTAASENLTLQSTTHATRGKIFFGSNSAYDEVNNFLGIGVTSQSESSEKIVAMASGNSSIVASGNGGQGLILANSARDASGGSAIQMISSRGTLAARTISQIDDRVGILIGYGWSAAAGTVREAASIDFNVDAEPDTAGDTQDMPGRITFLTSPDGSSTRTERMRIDNAGKIGIGGLPDAKFQVYDAPSGQPHVRFGDTTATSGTPSAKLTFQGATVQHAGIMWTPVTSGIGKMQFTTGGSADPAAQAVRMTLQNDGNLGIGTTSPSAPLTVTTTTASTDRGIRVYRYSTDTGNGVLRFFKARGTEAAPTTVAASDVVGGLDFQSYDGSAFVQGATVTAFIDGAVSTGVMPTALTLNTTTTNTLTERMRITSAGNVSIGTATPTNKFEVMSASSTLGSTTSQIAVDDNTALATGVGGSIILRGSYITGDTTSMGAFGGIKAGKANATALDLQSYLSLYARNSTIGLFEGIRLTETGNVGIATTTPGARLEVVGDIISKGTAWTLRTAGASHSWRIITYGNGLFVAVGDSGDANRVMTSPDGINWTLRAAPNTNLWNAVTYGNGLFVAVAGSGAGNRVMTSPDGITWTARTSAADNAWRSVTYGNGLFVAVALDGTGNRVMTSPDGITWTARTSAADNQWTSVTYGNGLFVAVAFDGTGNRVMTSPDGITWTSRTSAADNSWLGVTYGNGLFAAVGATGTGNRVMTSPDGITWTSRTSAADNSWFGITYGNGLFVAVAQSGTGNRVMTSPDGITWTARTSAANNSWYGVTYGNGLFVATSFSSGEVMTSGKTELTPFSANNTHQGGLNIFGRLGVGTSSPEFGIHSIETDVNVLGLQRDSADVNGPVLVLRKSRANSAVQTNDLLGNIGYRGYGATGYSVGSKVSLQGNAAENWTDSAQGAYFRVFTTPIGSTTTAERMRIDAAGNLGIGTTSPAEKLDVSGNIQLKAIGNKFLIKEGSNASMGVATLSGGTMTVSNTLVTANSRILLTPQDCSSCGTPYISARSAGVSFTITSTSGTDASTILWMIVEPAP